MWAKNLLFLVVCGGGLLTLVASLAPSIDSADRPRARIQTDSVRAAVARVDAAFERSWQHSKLEPAPAAPELIVARRMSLALQGNACISFGEEPEYSLFQGQKIQRSRRWFHR